MGDPDPREHALTVQLRAFGAARSGASLGLPALRAFCGALLGKSLKGGLVASGGLDLVYNAARRQINDLSDNMATKLSILYYADVREALIKALGD